MVCSVEGYLLHLDLIAPVYSELYPDGTSDHRITLGVHLDIDIMETFFLIISFDYVRRCLGHIVRVFTSTAQIQAFLQFLLLTALHPAECPS